MNMRIGVLRLSLQGQPKGKQKSGGFYNAQFLGVSKELAKMCEEVLVYEHVYYYQKEETVKIGENITLRRIPVRGIGVNAIPAFKKYDTTLDVMLVFSDIQLAIPSVYRWTKKHNILFIPYIGVIESHSTSKVKKILMNVQIGRIVNVYKRCACLVKTPALQKQLAQKGICNTDIMAVGLDKELLRKDYSYDERKRLRQMMGLNQKDILLLFIGRLTHEKEPLLMINVLERLVKVNKGYKLVMIGKGELREQVRKQIRYSGLENAVQMIDSVPNSEMWKYYLAADCYINLNKQEIFGMAILEAMYYGCKVVAWQAPGPEFIIDNGKNGYVVDDEDDLMDKIITGVNMQENAHEKIISTFTWEVTARKVLETIERMQNADKIH